jgi:hypothetical protein
MRPRHTPWPTRQEILTQLEYLPDTGDFNWIKGSRKGDWAGSLDRHGNRRININGQSEMAHNLAWIVIHNEVPTSEIVHLDGDRSNNRSSNLAKRR